MGYGLVFGRGDIPARIDDEYNRWYDEEHMAEVLPVSGVLAGNRYVAEIGAPKYAAMYHLESPDVQRSAEWQRIVAHNRAHPSERFTAIRPQFFNFTRQILEQLTPDTNPAAGGAPTFMVCVVFSQVAESAMSDQVAAYLERWSSELATARLYRDVADADTFALTIDAGTSRSLASAQHDTVRCWFEARAVLLERLSSYRYRRVHP